MTLVMHRCGNLGVLFVGSQPSPTDNSPPTVFAAASPQHFRSGVIAAVPAVFIIADVHLSVFLIHPVAGGRARARPRARGAFLCAVVRARATKRLAARVRAARGRAVRTCDSQVGCVRAGAHVCARRGGGRRAHVAFGRQHACMCGARSANKCARRSWCKLCTRRLLQISTPIFKSGPLGALSVAGLLQGAVGNH